MVAPLLLEDSKRNPKKLMEFESFYQLPCEDPAIGRKKEETACLKKRRNRRQSGKADSWPACENHLLFLIKSRMIEYCQSITKRHRMTVLSP
jgi:hypothetical protein